MEKRRHPRKEFSNRIGMDLVSEKKGNYNRISVQGTGIDISPGGLGIITDQPLEKGWVLKLVLPLSDGEINVPVFSVIKWTVPEKDGFRVGVQFLT
jgi:hypothetical protein